MVSILDKDGNRKAETSHRHNDFYRSLEGCIARNIRESTSFYVDGKIARVDVVQDPEGKWINRNFKTRALEEIREMEDGGLEIITARSVYRFAPAKLKPPVYQDETDLIELYMTDVNVQFCNGFIYDEEDLSRTNGQIRTKYPYCCGACPDCGVHSRHYSITNSCIVFVVTFR